MSELWKRLKLPIEIASVLVGLALGVLALWGQLAPKDELIAELISTDTRFPVPLTEFLESLPTRVQKALLKDERLQELVPNQKTREAVGERVRGRVRENVEGNMYLGNLQQEVLGNGLLVITLRSASDRPIRNIKLSRTRTDRLVYDCPGRWEGRRLVVNPASSRLGRLTPRGDDSLVLLGNDSPFGRSL